jgi:hypothetical protein
MPIDPELLERLQALWAMPPLPGYVKPAENGLVGAVGEPDEQRAITTPRPFYGQRDRLAFGRRPRP